MPDYSKFLCATCGAEFNRADGFTVDFKYYCSSHARQAHAVYIAARIAWNRHEGLIRAGFEDCQFRNSEPDKEAQNAAAWQAVRQWNGSQNLFLFGTVGAGKTFAARCALFREFEKGRKVADISAAAMSVKLDKFNDGGLPERLSRIDVLLLDDIDKGLWTARAIRGLFEIFESRREGGNPTLVTSNLSGERLRDYIRAHATANGLTNDSMADATLDRLKPVISLEFRGRSLR